MNLAACMMSCKNELFQACTAELNNMFSSPALCVVIASVLMWLLCLQGSSQLQRAAQGQSCRILPLHGSLPPDQQVSSFCVRLATALSYKQLASISAMPLCALFNCCYCSLRSLRSPSHLQASSLDLL